MTALVVAGAVAVALGGSALVGGCRATPVAPPDDMGLDLSVGGDDLGAGGLDAAAADLACSGHGPEVCGNGCDDDGNGYTDDDDPACTSQMLVTLSMGTPALWRLVLEPQPHVVALDGNPVAMNQAMATYDRSFADAAFLTYEGATRQIDKRPIGGGATTTASPSYGLRDVCVFNGELIVLEPKNLAAGTGLMHRFAADGKTELGTVAVPDLATACSSDGTMLYVASHPSPGDSVIHVYAKGANGPVDTTATIAMPDALLNAGYDRIVDLAYIRKSKSFIALFAMSKGQADSSLDGTVMAPLSADGGVGAFIDGGVWHGVGEFMP